MKRFSQARALTTRVQVVWQSILLGVALRQVQEGSNSVVLFRQSLFFHGSVLSGCLGLARWERIQSNVVSQEKLLQDIGDLLVKNDEIWELVLENDQYSVLQFVNLIKREQDLPNDLIPADLPKQFNVPAHESYRQLKEIVKEKLVRLVDLSNLHGPLYCGRVCVTFSQVSSQGENNHYMDVARAVAECHCAFDQASFSEKNILWKHCCTIWLRESVCTHVVKRFSQVCVLPLSSVYMHRVDVYRGRHRFMTVPMRPGAQVKLLNEIKMMGPSPLLTCTSTPSEGCLVWHCQSGSGGHVDGFRRNRCRRNMAGLKVIFENFLSPIERFLACSAVGFLHFFWSRIIVSLQRWFRRIKNKFTSGALEPKVLL